MHIKIASRYKPYSHSCKTECMLPGTSLCFQVFPTHISCHDLSVFPIKKGAEWELNVRGPVENFTVQLDLEHGSICVWGYALEGYFRYRIQALTTGEKNAFAFRFEKTPPEGIVLQECQGLKASIWNEQKNVWLDSLIYQPKDNILFFSGQVPPSYFTPQSDCRLSFGNHKAQEWEHVLRRLDLLEIFPFWVRLGQQVPFTALKTEEGTAFLLKEAQRALSLNDKKTAMRAFKTLIQVGFREILVPQMEDPFFQGIPLPAFSSSNNQSPLALLSEGSQTIQSLFVRIQQRTLEILPLLPPEIDCGRFIGVRCGNWGVLDIEWTKKFLRRVVLQTSEPCQIDLVLPLSIKRFRLKIKAKEKGTKILAGFPLTLDSHRVYEMDNFET